MSALQTLSIVSALAVLISWLSHNWKGEWGGAEGYLVQKHIFLFQDQPQENPKNNDHNKHWLIGKTHFLKWKLIDNL